MNNDVCVLTLAQLAHQEVADCHCTRRLVMSIPERRVYGSSCRLIDGAINSSVIRVFLNIARYFLGPSLFQDAHNSSTHMHMIVPLERCIAKEAEGFSVYK